MIPRWITYGVLCSYCENWLSTRTITTWDVTESDSPSNREVSDEGRTLICSAMLIQAIGEVFRAGHRSESDKSTEVCRSEFSALILPPLRTGLAAGGGK